MPSFLSLFSPSLLPPHSIILMHMSKIPQMVHAFMSSVLKFGLKFPQCPWCFFLSLQQMHLNVSNLFVACATPRAKEGRARTGVGGATEVPAPHGDPRSQLLPEQEESSVPAGAASKPHKNQSCLPSPVQVCSMNKTLYPIILKEFLGFL